MSNFKSGSGNLDFGDDDEEPDESHAETPSKTQPDSAVTGDGSEAETAPDQSKTGDSAEEKPTTESQATYPYFVRRNNVGDERDTRLEIHVRDRVADQEGEFRAELADHLDTSEISKTDAREFALLAAYQNPERVAELMREDGFGELR